MGHPWWPRATPSIHRGALHRSYRVIFAGRRVVLSSHGTQFRGCYLTMPGELSAKDYSAAQPKVKRAKRTVVRLIIVAALISVAWFGRESWLRGAAELWIVS